MYYCKQILYVQNTYTTSLPYSILRYSTELCSTSEVIYWPLLQSTVQHTTVLNNTMPHSTAIKKNY